MTMLKYQPVSDIQADNNGFLADGVRGIKCIAAGSETIVAEHLNTRQKLLLAQLKDNINTPDEYLGTVELYENGAMNVFHKRDRLVIGYWAYRP